MLNAINNGCGPITRSYDLETLKYRPLVEQNVLTLICRHVNITSWRNLTFADLNKRQEKKKAAELYFPHQRFLQKLHRAEFMKDESGTEYRVDKHGFLFFHLNNFC